MATLSIQLFGKFNTLHNEHLLKDLHARKVQELLCYLLLHRHREHAREVLASLLWEECSTGQSKTYLRKILWQLQQAFDTHTVFSGESTLLVVNAEWIRIREQAGIWLDTEVFEQAFISVQGIAGEQLDTMQALTLQHAITLYQADLLEGWYQAWCLYERQRFQHMYLSMLTKLMGYSESHHEYEIGLGYGQRILQYDRAHETTHRYMMRLYYLVGNRTGALRQYEQCVAALAEELDVRPSDATTSLYQCICANQPLDAVRLVSNSAVLSEMLGRLKQVQVFLTDLQCQIQHNIQVIERDLHPQQ